MNRYFVDKELYDNTEANFNDLTIRYEHLEKVADERMSTILDIEKYCIDEKEDLISGCEVCEDILKMIDKLKGKKYYIKKTYTKRQIDKLKKKYENAVADYEKTRFEKEQLNSLVNSCQEEIRQLKKQLDKYENPEDMTLMMMWCTEKVKDENKQLKDKLSKIETLIINHNCDTGDIYYKYNSKFVKSELKQRILEILEGKEV